MRCITAFLLMRKQLGRPFRDATKGDIRSILKWMEEKGYKASTNEKFRQVLKLFYKTVYGNSECYPEQVKWFPLKLGKEKTGKESSTDMAEYLEEEEVQKVIESAPTKLCSLNIRFNSFSTISCSSVAECVRGSHSTAPHSSHTFSFSSSSRLTLSDPHFVQISISLRTLYRTHIYY